MDYKDMEENGTIDYYLDLKKYINEFINRNYPLSQEDLRSIVKNAPTDNVIQRQETQKILNDAMEDVLTNVADRNTQIINGASQGDYTEYSVQDYKKELLEFEQKMLEKLWEEQHREEQMQYEEDKQTTEHVTSLEETDVVEEREEKDYEQENENVQKITSGMIHQDERELSLIQLLQRARDRETLDEETTRKLDEIEKRVENGEFVPEEEIQLFFKAVTDSTEHSQRFDVLREKIEAYNVEQLSIQDERIAFGEERSDFAHAEKDLSKQMELASAMGDTEKMEEIQKQMDILQKRREELPKPQEIERKPQISDDEKDIVYEQLEQYGEHLQEEIDDYYIVKTPEFSIDDITEKVKDVKESDYKKRMDAIKRDRQLEQEKDIERS